MIHWTAISEAIDGLFMANSALCWWLLTGFLIYMRFIKINGPLSAVTPGRASWIKMWTHYALLFIYSVINGNLCDKWFHIALPDSKVHGTNMGPHLGAVGPRLAPWTLLSGARTLSVCCRLFLLTRGRYYHHTYMYVICLCITIKIPLCWFLWWHVICRGKLLMPSKKRIRVLCLVHGSHRF